MGTLLCFLSMILTTQALHLLPITKDEPTKQFYTTLTIGTNVTTQLNLLLDLGTNLTWLNCYELKSLKSLHNVACGSDSCEDVPGNGCNGGNSCLYQQPNPLGGDHVTGHVVQDAASFSTADGISQVSLRIFTFSCASDNDLQGFAPQVSGVLSLSPGTSSLARQVATQVDGVFKLSLCLPSYGTTRIPPSTTNPIQMTSTPMTTGSGDYLITVQSMYVGGTPLTLNTGGVATRLSTVVPYTVLQTDIYKALALSFTHEAKAMGISKVSPVAPFKDCFDAVAAKAMTRPETLNVPKIEIGLPGKTGGEVKWGFYGANTMVKVTEKVMCLAFYDDGGKNPKDWIVIGTHQLQDYMLEFDFGASTFSFLHDTTCST